MNQEPTTQTIAFASRTCGNCSLCCKLLEIPEIKKPANIWCDHAAPGCGGCKIYEKRPQACQDFKCRWLTAGDMGEHWFPARCGMVIHVTETALRVDCDRTRIGAWRQQPWKRDLDSVVKQLHGKVPVLVCCGDRRWLLSIGGEQEFPPGFKAYTISSNGTVQGHETAEEARESARSRNVGFCEKPS